MMWGEESPIQDAINKQLASYLDPDKRRNPEKLIVDAIDRQESWVVNLIAHFLRAGFGTRAIANGLGVSRNRIRRLVKLAL